MRRNPQATSTPATTLPKVCASSVAGRTGRRWCARCGWLTEMHNGEPWEPLPIGPVVLRLDPASPELASLDGRATA